MDNIKHQGMIQQLLAATEPHQQYRTVGVLGLDIKLFLLSCVVPALIAKEEVNTAALVNDPEEAKGLWRDAIKIVDAAMEVFHNG